MKIHFLEYVVTVIRVFSETNNDRTYFFICMFVSTIALSYLQLSFYFYTQVSS